MTNRPQKYQPGDVVGKRTVVRVDGQCFNRSIAYIVRCECGREKRLAASAIARSQSCSWCVIRERRGADVVTLGGRNFSIKEIASAMGRSYSSVYHWLRDDRDSLLKSLELALSPSPAEVWK